eukprot:13726992-Alexandrium_andersonii.AAC.1
MSASLVGSEMCIRDSQLPNLGGPGPIQTEPRIVWSRRNDRSSCFSPVSYTHLTLPTICSV